MEDSQNDSRRENSRRNFGRNFWKILHQNTWRNCIGDPWWKSIMYLYGYHNQNFRKKHHMNICRNHWKNSRWNSTMNSWSLFLGNCQWNPWSISWKSLEKVLKELLKFLTAEWKNLNTWRNIWRRLWRILWRNLCK